MAQRKAELTAEYEAKLAAKKAAAEEQEEEEDDDEGITLIMRAYCMYIIMFIQDLHE